MLLIDHFEATALTHPARPFLHFAHADGRVTEIPYGQANAEASRRAAYLKELGFQRGDVIGILMRNSPQWVLWHLANQKLGVATTTLNIELLDEELAELFAAANMQAVVHDPELHHRVEAVQGMLQKPVRIIDGMADMAMTVDHVARDRTIEANDYLSIVFTSGTSGGKPKGVVSSVGNVAKGVRGYHQRLGNGPDDRIMIVTPLYHASALHWGIGLTLICGGALVLTERFSRSAFWNQALRGGTTVIWTMGTLLHILLLDEPSQAEKQAVKNLRFIFGNGAASRYHEIVRRWGPIFFDGYGSSEAFGTLTDPDCFDTGQPYPCTGRLVPGVDLRIHEPETGQELPVGEVGEIVSPFGTGFVKYINDPKAMEESVRNGWFRTGDLGFFDETGRLFFVDRLKDIIRRGGKNIAAREIESVLMDMPGVMEAVALPKPDAIYQERIVVYIVPADSKKRFTRDEVRAYCDGRLAEFKWPDEILTVRSDELPRTPTGKIKKGDLKKKLLEGMSEGAV